jgi:Trk-type K+ transport system membrane component
MGIWYSIFGWKALFRWDVLACIVPGGFVAVGLSLLGVDWFPHHLLISQICLGSAAFLCLVKIIGYARESKDTPWSRVIFACVLSFVALSIGIWAIIMIQKHKTETVKVETVAPASIAPGITITQTAEDSDCSNIVAKDAKIKCEIEKKHAKAKR